MDCSIQHHHGVTCDVVVYYTKLSSYLRIGKPQPDAKQLEESADNWLAIRNVEKTSSEHVKLLKRTFQILCTYLTASNLHIVYIYIYIEPNGGLFICVYIYMSYGRNYLFGENAITNCGGCPIGYHGLGCFGHQHQSKSMQFTLWDDLICYMIENCRRASQMQITIKYSNATSFILVTPTIGTYENINTVGETMKLERKGG